MATAISNNLVIRKIRTTGIWARAASFLFLAFASDFAAADAYSDNAPKEVIAAAIDRITQTYTVARQRFNRETNSNEAAWQFSRACFDCADLASNNTARAKFSQEGIAAAERAIAADPKLTEAFYYRGLNQGQLARTRKLTALSILDNIERSWAKAITLNPMFDHAGPHRSIGILYRDAPGWPLSVGSSSKAKKHLEIAVQLAPDYPDNFISLLESYLDWGKKQTVQTNIVTMQKSLDAARKTLTGEFWQLSWHDWDHRWKVILSKVAVKPGKSSTVR